jgi:hypothetical protein
MILGFMLCDPDGYCVHGDENDPFGLASFELLVGPAIQTAQAWLLDHPGWTLEPAHEGDVEEPTLVSHIAPTA